MINIFRNTVLIILVLNLIGQTFAQDQSLVVPNDKDLLFYVNGEADFRYIDLANFESTLIEKLPFGGSYACAYDADNERVYIQQGKVSPNGLYYYDLVLGTFHYVGDAPVFVGGIPWLEYNNEDKLLYGGSANKFYIINPMDGSMISRIYLAGFDGSKSGGDLAFDSAYNLYVMPNSGLYLYDPQDPAKNVFRKSAEALPYYLTSMAIDKTDTVWIATNNSFSKLLNMDTTTGDYNIQYEFNHKINDLTDRPANVDVADTLDTDGDGVIDRLDDFPEDPDACGAQYTPSKLGTGTLAFEDKWPLQGDYDFNDLVINYRFTLYLKCESTLSKKMKIEIIVSAIGADYRNGFGIELPINSNEVQSVTGNNISRNLVNLQSNGLEVGHEKAVVIAFDNAYDNMATSVNVMTRTDNAQPEVGLKSVEIMVVFNDFIDSNDLANAPFNPFIFVNKVRGREVHLPGMMPTMLADQNYFMQGDDRTDLNTNYTYRNVNGLPWALNIPHKFRVPKEKVSIETAYNNFIDYIQDKPIPTTKWYSDEISNRNTNYIFIPVTEDIFFGD